ncbi:MAG: hypothetical protein NPIRA06_22070 [Nitrospirales bacterium]|nr:MAG: hypothetical protein NPIRA06_22070 [Nitrospirales bacterium]
MATSWEHLLGGYATNTLTDEEKRQLFKAALNDQALFDALADEEALKAMLADPEARQRVLASLPTTENAGVARKSGKWWDWFRQQSSLAWAGSMAAVGLALIFGWQMEKEWGPLVSQKQEEAKPSSREELLFRTQKPSDERATSLQKEALEINATQTEKIDGERQYRARLESDARERGQATSRQRVNKQVAQSPPAPSALIQPKDGRFVQPFSVPEASEVPMADKVPQGTVPGRMAVQATEEATQSFQSPQELFYAASGSLIDEVIGEENNNDRNDQTLHNGLSKAGKSSAKKKALSSLQEQDVSGGPAMPTAKGIRYSFIQKTKEGKDEELETRQVAGNWSEIRLAVESNVSGYLYVLAPLDAGKWQNLVPMDPERKKKAEGWIKVKSFQRVEYLLDQLTNPSGKTVASQLVVLVSPTPLNDLGQWLGSEVDRTGLLIEREAGAVFAIDPETDKEVPLRVLISLLKFS